MNTNRPIAALLLLSTLSISSAHAGITTAPLEYSHNGNTYEGQLITDSELEGKGPGVLIFPQWKGISDHELEWGRKLAAEGYTVLIADMYGKGKRAKSRDEARSFAMPFYQEESRAMMRDRANAALEQLRSQQIVAQKPIFAIGFCFGGTNLLELVRSGAELSGAISFHGNLDTPRPASQGDVRSPILVCHGGADPNVPWEHVTAFRSEMDRAGANHRFVIYSDAVHSFTDKNAGNDPSKGSAYNEAAAKDAWKQMLLFFEQNQ